MSRGELEELLVRAIRSDTQTNHVPTWIGKGGHDDKHDIAVQGSEQGWSLKVKSGKIVNSR
ncbi:MAG: hypothetical protein K0U36_00085, partial [Alphaproteobacteria bacterium]|nr:hypothetical protein [Alphaproteobacteria bacterium]